MKQFQAGFLSTKGTTLMQCYRCKFYEAGEPQSWEHPGEPAACLVASEVEDPHAMELITNLHQTLSRLNNCAVFHAKEQQRSILNAPPTHYSRQVSFAAARDVINYLCDAGIQFTVATVGEDARLITVPIANRHALEIYLS